MTFHVYKKDNGKLVNIGEEFALPTLLHQLWEKRAKPTNQGWHVSADDLIKEETGGKESIDSRSLIIDWDPNSQKHVALIELVDIYIYTYPVLDSGEAEWSVMMLRLRDVMDEPVYSEKAEKEKGEKIAAFVPEYEEEIFEFLYLNGWRWGVSGKTNAAFIHRPAREYFTPYFCAC